QTMYHKELDVSGRLRLRQRIECHFQTLTTTTLATLSYGPLLDSNDHVRYVSVTDGNAHTATSQINDRDQATTKVDAASNTTSHSFDRLNRLLVTTLPNGQVVRFN